MTFSIVTSCVFQFCSDTESSATKTSHPTSPTKCVTNETRSIGHDQSKTSPTTISTKSIISSDTDSYTGPPSTDSEAPPSYEDACQTQITVKSTVNTGDTAQGDDTLDENVEFSERLI